MKIKLFPIFILLVLSLVSCDELTGDSTGANDIITDDLLGGISFVELGGGRGLLRGTMDLGGAHSFRMKFNLPQEKLVRFYFFSNRNLEGGVEVVFERVVEGVRMKISLNGESEQKVLEKMGDELDLVIDIHNNHEDTHIILWNHGGPYNGDDDCVITNTCLYNTGDMGGTWSGEGRATGTFWGVEGDRSLILKLEGPLEAANPDA